MPDSAPDYASMTLDELIELAYLHDSSNPVKRHRECQEARDEVYRRKIKILARPSPTDSDKRECVALGSAYENINCQSWYWLGCCHGRGVYVND